MATTEERSALLGTVCPFCGAQPGERCTIRALSTDSSRRRRAVVPITTLDGGAHDARWQAALGRPAPVLAAVVEERQQRPIGGRRAAVVATPAERPW